MQRDLVSQSPDFGRSEIPQLLGCKIVKEAIRQVSVLRGRLGAFERNTLDANVSQLGITMENLMAAESSIRDADFAVETANLTRSQVLVASGGAVLAIANQTPQMVLQLLG